MIKLAKPNIPEEAFEKVIEVLKSGNLVQGKYVEEFEQKLAEYNGVKHAIAVSSGTAALHLSLLVLDIKEGDEVIVPAFTFPATANVVELVGAKPIFVDINLSDFCIDTNKIEVVISKNTKAIIPVHEFGYAAKMDDIVGIAKQYNLKIIEDAACALGTEFEDQKAGTFGELGCFSFHPRKAITTGEGGVVVTNDDRLSEKVKSLRNHGIQNINGQMDFSFVGLNYRMTDFQAVLGLTQLGEIEREIKARTEMARRYNEGISKITWIQTPLEIRDRKTVWQTYHLLVDDGIDRDHLKEYLSDAGIETNLGAYAIHLLRYYKSRYDLNGNDLCNAEKAYGRGLALPIGRYLNDHDIEFIIDALKGYKS